MTIVAVGEALALVAAIMATARPISAEQWLARIGLVAALGASEVVLAAICGVGGLRLVAIAAAAQVFVLAYVLTPSPGKPDDEPRAMRPVLAMRGATLLAAAVSGGFASPFVPMLAVPMAIAYTMRRPTWRDVALAAVVIALLLVVLVPVTASTIQVTAWQFAVLAGWTTILTTWIIGRRLTQLHEVLRSQSMCLARIREGALTDATSRRRGLESMTTKMAHELKNPLAAIKSLVQTELGRTGDERSQRRLDVVLGEIDRIGSILRDYLALARPLEEAHLAPVRLDDLMTDVATLLAGRAEAAGVALVVDGEGGALRADERLLKEAIVNVVCNAIEATPRGGDVGVSCARAADHVRLVIRDSGQGMAPEIAARVGTPFFTTREGGTGLGVLIARAAISQHGGTLAYESAPGAGTTATIVLPIDPTVAGTGPSREERASA